MANEYPLTIEEKIALIDQVLGGYIDIQNVFVSFQNNNKFYIDLNGNMDSYVKFNDYDADIKLALPSPEEISDEETRDLVWETQHAFKGRARALRKAHRKYKEEKFGEDFIKDCCRYFEIKYRLFTKMQENNRNISQLRKEINTYQEKNTRLNRIIGDIDKIEEYTEEVEWE